MIGGNMTIKTKLIEYMDGEEVLEAYMSWDDKSDKLRPGVLIGHAWAGRTSFECEKADEIAKLGYVGFALDMYGKGVNGESKEENARLMSPFIENREKLQKRMFLALEALKKQAPVDDQKLAAIGYCFGGLMALDLARCGTDITARERDRGEDGRRARARRVVVRRSRGGVRRIERIRAVGARAQDAKRRERWIRGEGRARRERRRRRGRRRVRRGISVHRERRSGRRARGAARR